MKPKVLLFCDYFWPGYRAGGPITTLKNTVIQLKDAYDFKVVTRDHDYLSDVAYEQVELDSWTKTEFCDVFYVNKKHRVFQKHIEIIRAVDPDIIYVNSFFSLRYSFCILLVARFLLKLRTKIILCPRGELKPSALNYKKLKKTIFIYLFKACGLQKKVLWQATNDTEAQFILDVFGSVVNLAIAPNFTWGVSSEVRNRNLPKPMYFLKVIFLARINDIKNLKFLLRVIQKNNWRIHLTIAGPIDDQQYWDQCSHIISKTDPNSVIEYLGEVRNDMVLSLIEQYHFLCLPSRGENFGQVIYEAISIGRPVIISDQTPWRNLDKRKAGFDVDISSHTQLQQALETAYAMNSKEWMKYCNGALRLAEIAHEEARSKTIKLFSN